MNILVLGNGFDLGHGLRTTYKDFLKFIDVFMHCYEIILKNQEKMSIDKDGDGDEDIDIDIEYYTYFINIFHSYYCDDKLRTSVDDFLYLVDNNKWVEHFKQVQIKEGWVDFEKEISRRVRIVDNCRRELLESIEKGEYYSDKNDSYFLELSFFNNDIKSKHITIKDIESTKEKMLQDLYKLTRALEIYLCEYVEKKELTDEQLLYDIKSLRVDRLLSFNYTDTFERYYSSSSTDFKTCYIHGKVKPNSNIDNCNLVLGIDEYLNDGREDEDNEFLEFKKFYQRIYNGTGVEYRDWIEQRDNLKSRTPQYHEEELHVFFYGHSLDVTDKDVIQFLIKARGAKTTVFYHSKKALNQQIANLVKVLGEEELIKRTGGLNKSIEFRMISTKK